MRFRAALLAMAAIGFVPAASLAQTTAPTTATPIQTPGRPGPYALDIRVATAGAPAAASFFPAVPAATRIPSRVFGLDFGAHVYLKQVGPARLGLGADLVRLRGTAAPTPPKTTTGTTSSSTPSSTTATAAPTTPDVRANITMIAPQVSLNFGSSSGWSYLSAGYGKARVKTARSAFNQGVAASLDSGSLSSINFGAGARWFRSAHLAFTFDLRFHLLSAGKAVGLVAATPSARVVTASAGISLR